jgi:hypothetical protein
MTIQTRVRCLAMLTSLVLMPSITLAEDAEPIDAMLSWSGNGRLFQTDMEQLQFLGVIEGVLYTQLDGEPMDEAFMECAVRQRMFREEQKTIADGNCVIVLSPDDNVFGSFNCEGLLGNCTGQIRFNSGTGKFKGVEGGSELSIRSPMRMLVSGATDVEDFVVSNGITIFTRLEYKLGAN